MVLCRAFAFLCEVVVCELRAALLLNACYSSLASMGYVSYNIFWRNLLWRLVLLYLCEG
jgi:hypothetical protein